MITDKALSAIQLVDNNFSEVSLGNRKFDPLIWTAQGLKTHTFWKEQRKLAKAIYNELKDKKLLKYLNGLLQLNILYKIIPKGLKFDRFQAFSLSILSFSFNATLCRIQKEFSIESLFPIPIIEYRRRLVTLRGGIVTNLDCGRSVCQFAVIVQFGVKF